MSPRLSDVLLRSQSDERLVALARDGHSRAFVTIVERYRRPLHGYARRLAGDARAEDVLQQAFLNAWAALNRGSDVQHLRGWLHQIVRHAAYRAAAGAASHEDELPETLAGASDPEAEVEARLLVQDTLAEVARLPERQRAALLQTAVEGRSRQEIAASLSLSEGAVRQLVHRARATVRAAATAITPTPVAAWAAGSRTVGVTERVAELTAGAGGASVAVFLKAGALVAATGAVATGVVEQQRHSGRPGTPAAPAAVVRAADATVPLASAAATPRGLVHRSPSRGFTDLRRRVPDQASSGRGLRRARSRLENPHGRDRRGRGNDGAGDGHRIGGRGRDERGGSHEAAGHGGAGGSRDVGRGSEQHDGRGQPASGPGVDHDGSGPGSGSHGLEGGGETPEGGPGPSGGSGSGSSGSGGSGSGSSGSSGSGSSGSGSSGSGDSPVAESGGSHGSG